MCVYIKLGDQCKSRRSLPVNQLLLFLYWETEDTRTSLYKTKLQGYEPLSYG